MDMNFENNYTRLCGCMGSRPVFSHMGRNEAFYVFPLEISRLSGNMDTVNIVVRESDLSALEDAEGRKLLVTGELRTYNNRRSEGAKLVITVLAKELSFCDEEDSNTVMLSGTLCKEPKLRTTPLGRDICDMMLAVNRHYGRSDYLPCICWGIKARQAALWAVGTRVNLIGRIQSRRYIKITEEGSVEKTAYEVSVTEIEEAVPAAMMP